MKNTIILLAALFLNLIYAQNTANRFFYEFSVNKNDSVKSESIISVLDITDKKSIYQDYTLFAQDSITKIQIEEMQKTKQFGNMSKLKMNPKFSYKVVKEYPDYSIQFSELIFSMDSPFRIAYNEKPKFNWEIQKETQKIGEYKTQKATTTFGGRTWVAWFTNEIPFQEGPYKFYGLPGLIVKIEDTGNNYSWILKGNKKIDNYSEFSYIENLQSGGKQKVMQLSKEKFTKTYTDFRKDPFGNIRGQIPANMLNKKMPGSDMSIGDMLSSQENNIKNMYNPLENPIELE